jgi:hypothetical protein
MVSKPFNLSLRGEYLTLAVCVGLSLTMLFLPGDTRIRVADRLGLVLTAPYWSVRNFGADVLRVREDNAWLRQRVAELELEQAAADRMVRDAERMAGPALDPGFTGDLVPCRVVMRQRGRFATMIKIQSAEPVAWRPWQPVISSTGFLGRIRTLVGGREAWVELMTAPEFALGVEFERTGLLGVVRPRAGGFAIEMVGRDEDVKAGDLVITSGIAEIRESETDPRGAALTPRGFPVGRVLEVRSPSDRLFKEIVMDPAASFDYNETVFVAVPLGGEEAP